MANKPFCPNDSDVTKDNRGPIIPHFLNWATQALNIFASISYYDQSIMKRITFLQIDAGFISELLFDESRMSAIGDEVKCAAGDVGVMAPPTSAGLEFIQWWNAGLSRVQASREYGIICDRLETEHGMNTHKQFYSII